MSRLRYWSPGREWTTVSPGRVWYKQDEQRIEICALLSGMWGACACPEAGEWNENFDQLWQVEILKSTMCTYDVPEHCDLPPITRPVWDCAYCELGNKPHRAIMMGLRDGQFVARCPVPWLFGLRQLDQAGLVWYETAADRRAVRLWAQARARRAQALRRRRRRARYLLERGEWQKYPRRYNRFRRRMAQKDARW